MDDNLKIAVICAAALLILVTLGVLEKQRNKRNLKKFEITINVNGIRGKSTATRLITAILWEAGYRAIGKTTGTAARMMFWDKPEEEEVKRQPRGVSIAEQIRVIDKAAKKGANALVCECMAVKPEYQRIYQHQIIQAKITVIVNVLRDHIDDMGPTTEQIAWAFADTIPYDGVAVIPDCEYTDYFKSVAEKRNSKVFVADDSNVPQEFLNMFDYRLFDHNCAVAFAVAEALGIDEQTAMVGMLNAHPDPGALRIYSLENQYGKYHLVNAFAANEPSSSLELWEDVCEDTPGTDEPVIIMNCRPDRVDRTRQFVNDFFPMIPNATLVVIGENTRLVTRAYEKGKFPNVVKYLNFEKQTEDKVLEELEPLVAGKCVLCVGNIHGSGEIVLDELLLRGGAGVEVTMAYEKQLSAAEPRFKNKRRKEQEED